MEIIIDKFIHKGCKKWAYNAKLHEVFLLEHFSPFGSPELAAKILRAEKNLGEYRKPLMA